MSNHISAKFFGFVYAQLSDEEFLSVIPGLKKNLRRYFPRNDVPTINGVQVRVSDSGVATLPAKEVQRELHMVDANGMWGMKIGNTGVSFSTANYISYEEAIEYIQEILTVIVETVGIYHFSRASLRNINIFNPSPSDGNVFEDIEHGDYWGTQDFVSTLSGGFLCKGASTRHNYFSSNYRTQVQIASGVVFKGQSHIPQEEWDIWRMRGGVPVQTDVDTKLLVDISGTRFEAPIDDPEQQHNLSDYSWEAVKQSFDELHSVVNSVYSDITTKD